MKRGSPIPAGRFGNSKPGAAFDHSPHAQRAVRTVGRIANPSYGNAYAPPTNSHRRGLSLLEVILAIAVLGGSMAVIGELVRMGVWNAEEARELTKAQLLCEGKLEEVAAGITPLESAADTAFELDPEWSYTIETGTLDQQGLIQVRVTVQQVESERLYPLTFTLTRWILDPSLTSGETTGETSGETSTETTTGGQTDTSGSSNATP